jgi:hypothetical protein
MSVLMDVYVGSYVAAVGGATKAWHKDFPLPSPGGRPHQSQLMTHAGEYSRKYRNVSGFRCTAGYLQAR